MSTWTTLVSDSEYSLHYPPPLLRTGGVTIFRKNVTFAGAQGSKVMSPICIWIITQFSHTPHILTLSVINMEQGINTPIFDINNNQYYENHQELFTLSCFKSGLL